MLPTRTFGVVLPYPRAVRAADSLDVGRVMEQTQQPPVGNIFVRNASLRAGGRVKRGMYLARVNTPGQSMGPWDYLEQVRGVRAKDAVRPASESPYPPLRKASRWRVGLS